MKEHWNKVWMYKAFGKQPYLTRYLAGPERGFSGKQIKSNGIMSLARHWGGKQKTFLGISPDRPMYCIIVCTTLSASAQLKKLKIMGAYVI